MIAQDPFRADNRGTGHTTEWGDTSTAASSCDRIYIRVPTHSVSPMFVDPFDEKIRRHARNKIEQALDCEQYYRPPKKCGRGPPPLRKWDTRKPRRRRSRPRGLRAKGR